MSGKPAFRPSVMQTEDLDPGAAAWLGERCDVVACAVDDPRAGDVLARADGMVVRTYTRVDRALLKRAPKLRVVGRAGVGLDSIDVGACRERGVEVVYTPDANSSAVCEFVVALMLDALRPRVFLDKALDQRAWVALRKELRAPRQLCELTLGILGLGRVGRRVARAAAGLGMRVLYNDLVEIAPAQRFGAEPVALATLLGEADVLSVHIDPRPSNDGFIGAGLLKAMKADVTFINTSRGKVVDSAALAAFLCEHPGSRALIDVHEPEPFVAGYPLLGLPNAYLSAHIAAATQMAQTNMSWVVRDVWRVLSGEAPEHAAPRE